MLDANDSSYLARCTLEEVQQTQQELRRPCMLLKVDLFLDGDQFCAMYPARRDGGCVMESVCGFGSSPEQAMLDFDAYYCRPVVNVSTSEAP